ncbi:MAG: hypothetical protein H7A37_09960 [Chlamydiales bacterium]|nr:hypothetical protein [Chlamydiia bacterium]MCP5508601.1 hypothetical protein [Chlamydiales bacterium]
MKRGLFYCQHLGGIGHLTSGLSLSRELVKSYEIDFLQGGSDVGLTFESPYFHHYYLPPITREITSNSTEKQLIAKFKSRAGSIFQIVEPQTYDFMFIEGFPFGKYRFSPEIIPIINTVKKNNPNCLICCSTKGFNREELPRLPLRALREYYDIDRRTFEAVRDYFDVIFMHSDPDVIKLEDVYLVPEDFNAKLIYTGFTMNKPKVRQSVTRKNLILAVCGSGHFGAPIMVAAWKLSAMMTDYDFILSTGQMMDPKIVEKLKQNPDSGNVEFVSFIHDFHHKLHESKLVISMGGTTLFDLYETKTPGIVFPYGGPPDQTILARKFAERGLVTYLNKEDLLSTEKLKRLALETIEQPYPDVAINTNGTVNTKKKLDELLSI